VTAEPSGVPDLHQRSRRRLPKARLRMPE
jgi:hypothetical protein